LTIIAVFAIRFMARRLIQTAKVRLHQLVHQFLGLNSLGKYKIIQREPIGVCSGIGAWNVSAVLFAWKVAPALAAGNTFIYKPSEKAPLGILSLGKHIKEIFPPGVINIINGAGTTGQLMAAHM
jgi:acyl-CoA reductase-like NAD-dependent aldehyde dehydrogenase